MLHFFYTLPDKYLFLLVCLVAISVSIFLIYMIKHVIRVRLRYRDNAIVGSMSALISLIYGVLAGLTALYLINNNSYTTDAAQREANAVANIYRDTKWLPNPLQGQMQEEVKKYILETINIEWPLMRDDKPVVSQADWIIDQLSVLLSQFQAANFSNQVVMRALIDEIKALYDARQQRIQMSTSLLSGETWFVILIGTILTIAINYLFKADTIFHLITVIAAALMTSAMIFLLMTLDRPFQGEFYIAPNAMQAVLAHIRQDASRNSA